MQEGDRYVSGVLCAVGPVLRCLAGHKGVRRYQTKPNGDPHSDRSSTSNLKKHAEGCWGGDAVRARLQGVTNPANVQGGNIFASFARAGQRPVNVSHRAHTDVEARYVSSVLPDFGTYW